MTQSPTYAFQPSPWAPSAAWPFVENLIRAVGDDNAGPTAPPNPFPFMKWRQTGITPTVLWIRNATNTAWLNARVDLGASALGEQLLLAADQAAARQVLGGPLNWLTPVQPTSQAAISFAVGAGANYIRLDGRDLSTNGTSNILMQLGDAGGFENTGYSNAWVFQIGSSVSVAGSTSSFPMTSATAAVTQNSFTVELVRVTGNRWAFSMQGAREPSSAALIAHGDKTLSDPITQLRLITANGTDLFDAGIVACGWGY